VADTESFCEERFSVTVPVVLIAPGRLFEDPEELAVEGEPEDVADELDDVEDEPEEVVDELDDVEDEPEDVVDELEDVEDEPEDVVDELVADDPEAAVLLVG
jgi:hypothetical protein